MEFKLEMTRHESLVKPIINPQAVNIELLFKQVTFLQQEREQWRLHCEKLERCNKTTNEINDSLLSKVAILEEVSSVFCFCRIRENKMSQNLRNRN